MNLSKTRRGRLALIDSWQMKQKALLLGFSDFPTLCFCACAFCLAACLLLACLARMGPMRRHFYGQFAERQAVFSNTIWAQTVVNSGDHY